MIVQSTFRFNFSQFSFSQLKNNLFLFFILGLSVFLISACTQTGSGGDVSQASTPAQSSPEKIERDWTQLVNSAQEARSRGDLQTAMILYRRAYALHPNRTKPLFGMAEIAEQAGRYPEASEYYRKAVEISPASRQAYLGAGKNLVRTSQPLAAIPYFEKILEANPEDIEALNGIAVANNNAGFHEEGKSYLRRALAFAPDDMSSLNNYGYALIETGHYKEAVRVFQRLNSLPEANAKHRQNLAMAYVLVDREGDARGVLQKDFDEDAVNENIHSFRQMKPKAPGAKTNSPTPSKAKPLLTNSDYISN